MTTETDEPAVLQRTVVIFDICSSSNILEDLLLSDNVQSFRNLIISIKSFLKNQESEGKCEVYKFIGDGWIVLFPYQVHGTVLIHFMEELTRLYAKKVKKHVVPHLQTTPAVMGLSFGVDRGRLVRLTMMNKTEYVGRPINIASRLQSAIKQKDDNPSGKVLISKPAFSGLGLSLGYCGAKVVHRTLRNIQGGKKYSCVKLRLKL